MNKKAEESISLICFSVALVFGVLAWIDDGSRGQSPLMLPSMIANCAGMLWTTWRFMPLKRPEKNGDYD